MTFTSLDTIYGEWQNNAAFRLAFKENPELALKNAGFEVSADDLIKIRAILTHDNTSLDDRINK